MIRILSKTAALAGAAALAAMIAPAAVSGQTLTAPVLAAEYCTPLTDTNMALCCVAANRDDLLLPEQAALCPLLSAEETDATIQAAIDAGTIPDGDETTGSIGDGFTPPGHGGANPGETDASVNPTPGQGGTPPGQQDGGPSGNN